MSENITSIIKLSTAHIVGTITMWNLYNVFDKECDRIKEINPYLYRKYNFLHYGLRFCMLGLLGSFTINTITR
jgi:hypothetical protein